MWSLWPWVSAMAVTRRPFSASAISTRVPTAMAVVGWVVAGLGMGLISASLAVLTLAMSPPDRQGEHSSALQLSDVLGFALGTGLGGAIIALADRHGATVDGSSVHAGVLLVFGVTAAVGAVGVASARRMHRYLGGDEPPTANATAAANAAGAATSSS